MAASLFRFAIADYSLWFDEQASMFFSQQPLARLWSSWILREPNPPLYYSLLKGWEILFGDSERAVRTLSIAAGAGSIFTTAIFTDRIYGRRAAIIAGALTAISTQQLYYSLQVRSYEILYLASSCVLISVVAIERGLRLGRPWTSSLLGYALGCAACIYLHTTMFLLPVICSISLVLVRRHDLVKRPGLLLPLMAANLAIAMAAGWWLGIVVRQVLAGAENIAVFDRVTPWFIVKVMLGVLSLAKEPGSARVTIALLALLLIIYQVQLSWKKPETKLLVTIVGISIAVFSLISINVPILLPRTMFWLSTIATALGAAGIAGIRRPAAQWGAIIGFGALVLLNMGTWVESRQTEDWNSAIGRAESLPGSRLIVQGEAMGLLLATACDRQSNGKCPVPILVMTTPDDRLDDWSSGLYSGRSIAIKDIGALPAGRYFVFRKEFYHDVLKTLHSHGHAHFIGDDPPLLGPVDRLMLLR